MDWGLEILNLNSLTIISLPSADNFLCFHFRIMLTRYTVMSNVAIGQRKLPCNARGCMGSKGVAVRWTDGVGKSIIDRSQIRAV